MYLDPCALHLDACTLNLRPVRGERIYSRKWVLIWLVILAMFIQVYSKENIFSMLVLFVHLWERQAWFSYNWKQFKCSGDIEMQIVLAIVQWYCFVKSYSDYCSENGIINAVRGILSFVLGRFLSCQLAWFYKNVIQLHPFLIWRFFWRLDIALAYEQSGHYGRTQGNRRIM